jgi:hypothetical protein
MTVTPETPKPAIRIAVRDNEVVKAALRALGAGIETDFRAGIEKIVRAEVARIMQSDR